MMSDLSADLITALRILASAPQILIASDFDGCLAPLVSHPGDARSDRAALGYLVSLSSLPSTTTAIISGRARNDLARLIELAVIPGIESVVLIGSHGSEFEAGFARSLTKEQRVLLMQVECALTEIASRFSGTAIEVKPASAVLHVRNATDTTVADAAIAETRKGPASLPGVHVTEGKDILELAVIEMNKGYALADLRAQCCADAVCYIGDDVTDENAFRHLDPDTDVGIKVGTGETIAHYRIAGPEMVGKVLETLLAARR